MHVKKCAVDQNKIINWTCKVKNRHITCKDKILSECRSPNSKHPAKGPIVGKLLPLFDTNQTFPKVVQPHSGNQT